MHKLVEYICEELEELERKAEKDGKLSMAEIQYMDTLAHAKKNLLKGEMMMEESGGSSYYDGGGSSYRMDGGSSYRRRGSSRAGEESGQSRARGRGRNARRDSMGRYSSRDGGSSYYEGGSSYADEVNQMVDSIYNIMDDLPENVKQDAQRLVKKIESAM